MGVSGSSLLIESTDSMIFFRQSKILYSLCHSHVYSARHINNPLPITFMAIQLLARLYTNSNFSMKYVDFGSLRPGSQYDASARCMLDATLKCKNRLDFFPCVKHASCACIVL